MEDLGRPRKIPTPERFLELFNEWMEWKLKQVIKVPSVTKMGPIDLEHTPPLTWAGFDAWLFQKGIVYDTDDYRGNKNGAYGDFSDVIRAISNIMYANKFEGAAVGAFNANIISRDLGLAEKTSNEHKIKLGKDIEAEYED